LGLGAPCPGMDFQIAIVAVGLARQQAFELAPCRLGSQLSERGLSLGDDLRLALGFAERDQLERVVDLVLNAPVAGDRLIEPGALAQQLLRSGRVIP
jgi:hypothetical protein